MPPIKSHLPSSAQPLDLEVSRLRKGYSSDPVIVDGIVGESPQSSMTSRAIGGGYRIHMFKFAVWKIDGASVRTDELLLSRAIPNSNGFQFELKKYSYHRIRILLSADETRAIVLDGIDASTCPEDLSTIAKSLVNPVKVGHTRFGTLTLNRALQYFSGNTNWNGAPVDISIPADGEALDTNMTTRAEQVFHRESELSDTVLRFLVESVISEHDDAGLDSKGVEPLLELQALEFSDSGYAEFWYNDAGLWGGSSLVVLVDPADQLSFSVEG